MVDYDVRHAEGGTQGHLAAFLPLPLATGTAPAAEHGVAVGSLAELGHGAHPSPPSWRCSPWPRSSLPATGPPPPQGAPTYAARPAWAR